MTMRLGSRAITLLLLAVCASGFADSSVFAPDSYMRHVKYLAGDELRGRGNGTPELDRAAEYIARQFQASGLEPAGDDGSYFQSFMLSIGSRLGPRNELTFSMGRDGYASRLEKDFVPIGVGDQADVTGDLVFAGYGISALEYKYDDYSSLKVADKIVLVLADWPREKDPASPLKDSGIAMIGSDITKALNAKYRGAKGVLIVKDPLNHPEEGGDLPDLAVGVQVDDLGIPVLRITRPLAQRLLDTQKKNLLEVQKEIDEKLEARSFEFEGVRATVRIDVTPMRKEVRNVAGFLPGQDPALAEEFVILGAHYDHLGLGGRGSLLTQMIGEIHNGADDNASGTAGLIELASVLGRQSSGRKRSYLFLAFAGEELGLHGSSYWTNHPTRSLSKAVAMLNMDMIGRSKGNQVAVGWTGTSPLFESLVAESARRTGVEARASSAGPRSSDHWSFYMKDIPVLFFFSGLHSDYHRPTDDWEKINNEAAARILSLVHSVAVGLNTRVERPQFAKVETPDPLPASSGNRSGYGPMFGSIPDMTTEVKGVLFADIRPGTPAAKAGLRGKDILVRFAGKEVQTLEDFTFLLRNQKAGDTVEVTVLRDGKPLIVKVTLEARR